MDFSQIKQNRKNEYLKVHQQAIVINGLDPTRLDAFNENYVLELKTGGFTAICISAISPEETMQLSDAVHGIASWYGRMRAIGAHKVRLATTSRDIEEAKKEGQVAIVFTSQSSGFLGFDLTNLEVFHRLGLRIMQPTYQRRNQFGDGAGEKMESGLSGFGVEWVQEMNRLHLLISISHVGYKTSLDIMNTSKDLVVLSHSNPRALCGHSRNAPDNQIKACAERGGVIGLMPLAAFISDKKGPRELRMDDFLKHVDYIVNLVGVDHAGIGLDLPTGWFSTPEELLERRRLYPGLRPQRLVEIEDELIKAGREKIAFHEVQAPWFSSMSQAPLITEGLLARGYSEQDVLKILGGNFLRAFKRVWGS